MSPISADLTVSDFLDQLHGDPGGARVYPVLDGGRALGIVDRLRFLEAMSSKYARDLFGRNRIRSFVPPDTLRFEATTPLEFVVRSITGNGANARLSDGIDYFLVVQDDAYIGVGFAMDLLSRLTEVQLELARQANPLTALPGNAPIERRIARLLERGVPFKLGYCDLDNFKSFNDRYGHARGDALILALAQVLQQVVLESRGRTGRTFVGHVGGDDFVVLVSWDLPDEIWQQILEAFALRVPALYDTSDLQQGGIRSVDRRGQPVFHPLATLSIGVVPCSVGRFRNPQEVGEAVAEVKRLAKLIPGNSWFQERRTKPNSDSSIHPDE